MSERASTDDGNYAPRQACHWTHTYRQWEGWEDPDEVAEKREQEEKRMKNFSKNNVPCAHDRSAERKVMEMSIKDKLEACRDFRQRGNQFHQEGQYRRAALQYRRALIYYDFCFPDEEPEQQELDEIQQACLLNSAACFLACRELDETLDCCYQVLRAEPDNAKALYRRAVVYRLRDQFREASVDLRKALAQRPNDVALRKESVVLKSKIAAYRERRKEMGERIFGTGEVARAGAGEECWPLNKEPRSCLDGDHGAEAVWDPLGNLGEAAGREWGGGYAVAGVGSGPVGVDEGGGSGEEEGRRRHDLLLPVCVDLSELEETAGCTWPVDA